MISESSVMKENIVEAAMRRFSHFGVNKTTLNEIAMDLGISKASFFYYFNDKDALIVAVFEKLVNDFLISFKKAITSKTTAEEALMLLIDTKLESYKNNLQLALQAGSVQVDHKSPKILKPVIKAQREVSRIVKELLEKGMQENDLQKNDSKEVTRIILDTIQSHEICLKHSSPFPSEKELDELAVKQKAAIQLFFNGLKQHSTTSK